jgi:hypothetical protein
VGIWIPATSGSEPTLSTSEFNMFFCTVYKCLRPTLLLHGHSPHLSPLLFANCSHPPPPATSVADPAHLVPGSEPTIEGEIGSVSSLKRNISAYLFIVCRKIPTQPFFITTATRRPTAGAAVATSAWVTANSRSS